MSDEYAEKTQALVAKMGSAMIDALVILDKCLLNNGALKAGQFSGALKQTFNHPDADWERLDYAFFQQLAKMIDEAEIQDRNAPK